MRIRDVLYLAVWMPLALLTACSAHEWPDQPGQVALLLKLSYDKGMTTWPHIYDGEAVTADGAGETYDNGRTGGKIRYVVRVYPASEKRGTANDNMQEFLFTKDISEGYDHEVTLSLAPGDYDVMVWSDLTEGGGEAKYDAGDFAEITLQGVHEGGDDYRDAFRGSGHVSLVADIREESHGTLDIAMERPLAKFEFVTDDLEEFVERETARASRDGASQTAPGEGPATRVDIDDYQVAFFYVGFMPDTYSMFTDKPVDSSTGVMFRSSLKAWGDGGTSMGFDYVFVNGAESSVTLQVGIYDKDGTRLSLTDPIKVPLRRSRHTVVRGRFLMTDASGGVSINPGYDGDYNLFFP